MGRSCCSSPQRVRRAAAGRARRELNGRQFVPEVLSWRDTAWGALFELGNHTAIFTHFMIINAICSRLMEAPETVCCVPDNGSVTRLKLDGNSLELVEVGRQMQTVVN